jgi:hypothetical protein
MCRFLICHALISHARMMEAMYALQEPLEEHGC